VIGGGFQHLQEETIMVQTPMTSYEFDNICDSAAGIESISETLNDLLVEPICDIQVGEHTYTQRYLHGLIKAQSKLALSIMITVGGLREKLDAK